MHGKLDKALSEPVESLLDSASNDTSPSIRNLLWHETQLVVSGLASAFAGFDIDQKTVDELLTNLKDYARSVVETKAREEAGRVLIRMKDRFSTFFSHDSDSMPRVWTGKEDIRAITKAPRSASLKLLSVMAAIRLDDDADNIENTLSVALVDTTTKSGGDNRGITSFDPLASSTWEEVPPTKTMITPVQCKSLWRQFKTETEYSVTQAIAVQEATTRNNNWLPPPWAIVALLILGFNEFMTLLSGGLWLKRDITEYGEFVCSFNNPSINEKFEALGIMANVFIVAPESLSSLLEGTSSIQKDAQKFIKLEKITNLQSL